MSHADAKQQFLAKNLREGEEYAGLILGKNGKPDYHLVLLPGQVEDVPWGKAVTWAKKQGGELPTRREQSMLFANLPEAFDKRWYWSVQAEGDAFAWYQNFYYGSQDYVHKSRKLRARAVRRLILE